MKKCQCKLKIFTHNFYDDGTEGEEQHFISYYKKQINQIKGNHKKNKSLNLTNKELDINSIFPNDNNKLSNNQQFLKTTKSPNSKLKNSNNTTSNNNKELNSESITSGATNKKFSSTYNNNNINIKNKLNNSNNQNLNKSQNFNSTLKAKKEMLNNRTLYRSKSPNSKKITNKIKNNININDNNSNTNNSSNINIKYNNNNNSNIFNNNINNNSFNNHNYNTNLNINNININQITNKNDEKVSNQINEIIIIKEKINDLIREESELEKQKYDITDHFEYKLRPIRELNQQLIIQNKIYIDKEDELNGQLALLKNHYSQLINQLNEKKNIIDGLNLNYENEKNIFEQQKKYDENNLYNFYTQAVEDLENGKEIELDDMP